MGLGFTSLSTIDAVINQTGASTGRTLLYNLFQDNPSEPNFIAFSLDSSSDGDGISGSFSIGVYTLVRCTLHSTSVLQEKLFPNMPM